MLRANLKWKLITHIVGSCLVLILAIGMTGCEQSVATATDSTENIAATSTLVNTDGPLAEVNIPQSITKLALSLEKFQPQVRILSPQAEQTFTDDRVSVTFQVSDFPLFKSPQLGLGNHLHVILDKQTYQGVYDLTQPLVFKNLAPGTHTLRVFASRPWHESFKNAGAYAQTTFHVFTKTAENNPDSHQPLLTYSRPAGTYGAEPILLDYYLTNAPTRLGATDSSERTPDWKIRVTINNQQFMLDRWEPIYLQGFKPGKNLVRLELLDARGNPIPNVYNDTVGVFDYDLQTKDSLTKLIQGEIPADLARTLVDPSYVAANPALVIEQAPVQVPAPSTATPAPVALPLPNSVVNSSPQPSVIASPGAIVADPPPSPSAIPLQQPIATPSPQYQQPTGLTSMPTIVVPSPVIISPAPQKSTLVPNPVIISSQPQPSAIPSPIAIIPSQPIPIPIPVTIVPQQPNDKPSAPAIAIPIPKLTPLSTATPTPTNAPNSIVTVQPQIAPPSVPIPVQILPSPLVVTQPSPNVATPSPKTPTAPPPQAVVAIPVPMATPQPTASIDPPTPQANPRPVEPINQPQTTASDPDRWQAKAIELIKFAGVKIRAFTNTIPAKAQRFGHNMQTWAGRAIDLVRSWQNKEAG